MLNREFILKCGSQREFTEKNSRFNLHDHEKISSRFFQIPQEADFANAKSGLENLQRRETAYYNKQIPKAQYYIMIYF